MGASISQAEYDDVPNTQVRACHSCDETVEDVRYLPDRQLCRYKYDLMIKHLGTIRKAA